MRSGFLHWFEIFQRWLLYLSIYLSIPVSFDPGSFEVRTIHLRTEWIYEWNAFGRRGKKKERKIENPFSSMEKRYLGFN